MTGCLAYLIQDPADKSLALVVADTNKNQHHVFPISVEVAARLAAECSDRIRVYLGAVDLKRAHGEIVSALSNEWDKP